MFFFDEIDQGIKTDDTNKQPWEWKWGCFSGHRDIKYE